MGNVAVDVQFMLDIFPSLLLLQVGTIAGDFSNQFG